MSKKTWVARTAKALLFAMMLTSVLATLAIWWFGHRDVAPVTTAQQQQSFQRAVGWMRTHEADILKEPNAALWGMVQAAAERSSDPYLLDLVRRSVAIAYPDANAALPWKRMVYPNAEVTLNLAPTANLDPYQRFYYHAVTCLPVPLDDGDTTQFLLHNECSPQITKVWLGDQVCTTHQLVGVKLFQRVGCSTQADLKALESDLLADIDQQMRLDVLVKDAYVQRVLMLLWVGGPDHVKPIWMQRVLMAQQADGGWMGRRQMPEFPNLKLPVALRTTLHRQWPSRFPATADDTDFHATAQGLLISALAMTAPPLKH
jgi:hypothetical protein